MSLGSVVLIIFRNVDPLPERRAGYGRDVIGLGATAVTVSLLALLGPVGPEMACEDPSSTRRRRRVPGRTYRIGVNSSSNSSGAAAPVGAASTM